MAYYTKIYPITAYHGSKFFRPGTKNIGWLGPDHEFKKGKPAPTLIYHYVNVHDYEPPNEFLRPTNLTPVRFASRGSRRLRSDSAGTPPEVR